MNSDREFDAYLGALDKALEQIPISERAEIILEIKSHILENQERNPDESMTSFLKGMGEPREVAEKYLLERGLNPKKVKKSLNAKWLSVTFLGTLLIVVASTFIMLWKFTPLIAIDDSGITILGGAISITDRNNSNNYDSNDYDSNDYEYSRYKNDGKYEVDENSKKLNLTFTSMESEIFWNDNNSLEWSCGFRTQVKSDIVTISEQSIVLDLQKANSCKIYIPKTLDLFLEADNGKLSLNSPLNNYEIKMKNGLVAISPDEKEEFNYELTSINGHIGNFSNSNSRNAKLAEVRLSNGTILNNNND